MRVYWYWPFLRREELALAEGLVQPGDELVVHTTPRPADPIVSPIAGCEVRSSLPAVRERKEHSLRWVVSRATTYVTRAVARDRAVRGGGFDLAHVIYLNPFTDPFLLARLEERVPLVCSVHDVHPHLRRVPDPVERWLLDGEYRKGGTLLTHHDSVRRRLLDEFPVDPARVVVIPLPIPEIAGAGVRTEAARRDGPARVLFFGTFRRNKGVAELLAAIEALRGETDARFVFAGRGFPDIEEVVRTAARRDPRIIAEIGYATVERKAVLYSTADLVVLPYTSFASQSAVLHDAYSHRVPVVVTDVGALGETVRAEQTGWVVQPGDADALAAALLGALRDGAARERASRYEDAIARSRTPRLVGARFRSLYEQVIAARVG